MGLEIYTYAVCSLSRFLKTFERKVRSSIPMDEELENVITFYDRAYPSDPASFFKGIEIRVTPGDWEILKIGKFPLPPGKDTKFGLYLSYLSLRYLLQLATQARESGVPFHTLVPQNLFEDSDLAHSEVPISFSRDVINGKEKDSVHIRIQSCSSCRGETLNLDLYSSSEILRAWDGTCGPLKTVTEYEKYD